MESERIIQTNLTFVNSQKNIQRKVKFQNFNYIFFNNAETKKIQKNIFVKKKKNTYIF